MQFLEIDYFEDLLKYGIIPDTLFLLSVKFYFLI